MSFNIATYKRQCLSVAKAFKAQAAGEITVEEYEKTVAEADLLKPAVVDRIVREVILKGGKFRPIDAYQF